MPFKGEEEKDSPRDYLLLACLVIAVLELIHSLAFAFNSVYDLSLEQNTYNVLAYTGGVIYVLTVAALLVGLWKGLPRFLTYWLLFTGTSTALCIIIFIYSVAVSPVYDRNHFKTWTVIYLGIVYECTCLLLIFRYYRKLNPYKLLQGENYDSTDKEDTGQETESEDDWTESGKSGRN